jgi:hypothetical protein
MPSKKKPSLPAAEVKAERERFKKRAQESKARYEKYDKEPMLTTIAVFQSQTNKTLKEISGQLKDINQTLLAVLSALETVH